MKLPKLPFLEKRKFILSVGDEGGVLVLINGKTLEQRYFFESSSAPRFIETLNEYEDVPVFILADVLDQAYIQHTLPPVSALNIGQLVKRRLEKDFADEDIKAARKLYREKEGRKDWNYSFISIHNAPPFSDWLETVIESNNPFGGIYLLPIESENFIKKINAEFIGKKAKPPEWQILVSHNKAGGFRQVVYRDGKVLFTRIAQPIGGQAPDVIAGNIEQETLNTIEYVRRLGFDNDEKLDIVIIASQAVKSALETNTLHARQVIRLTPNEVAAKLNLLNASEKNDRFGDVIIASNFALSKPILRLNTPYSKRIEQVAQANTAAYVAAAILIPLLILLSVISAFNIIDVQNEIEISLNKKIQAQNQLDEILGKRETLPNNAEQVVETINLYKNFTKEAFMPLQFLQRFSDVKPSNVTVQGINFTVDEDVRAGNLIKSKFNTQLISSSSFVDRQLEDIDAFTASIREKFKNYEVVFAGLPTESDRITIGEAEGTKVRQLEITIDGPKVDDPRARAQKRRRRR